MTLTEFRLLLGNDWGIMLLSCILLYMFILRLRRVGGFLGIAGTIGTSVLLALLVWLQWNKYTVGQEILSIVEQQAAGYNILTMENKPMTAPRILEVNGVRYIIDAAEPHQKRHLPWTLIALPQ
ncbi:hypothetical protein N1030_05450 [Desulfovibrio mangrovi]|uniref:hypothetical protein n=1 Tax=Desulfovibrio mangrovi TaxID=2976983 RepID=UPI002248488F|nr:hypothetical protein [Desulfovibrio mangrovi]UZP68421.1 hypothetical protein N1030_05450 [Desulfovibrio mangrovi]